MAGTLYVVQFKICKKALKKRGNKCIIKKSKTIISDKKYAYESILCNGI